MGSPEQVTIPVLEVDRQTGLELKTASSILIDVAHPGYARFDGTSMAAPFVSGVAAKIWAARPDCTNRQIREALENTARDLGTKGRDDEYGHGFVQAEAAYLYLLNLSAPCGQDNVEEDLQSLSLETSQPTVEPNPIDLSIRKADPPTTKGTYKLSNDFISRRDDGRSRRRFLKGSCGSTKGRLR